MRNYFKNYPRGIILLFGISLIIYGCQKDSISIEDTLEEKRRLIKKRIFSKEIKENALISEFINERSKETKGSNLSHKEVYDETNDFYIETDQAIYIEDGEYHSYTFQIYRDGNNGLLENLILSIKSDNTYKATIAQYVLDNNNNIDYSQSINFIPLEDFDTSNILSRNTYVCENGRIVIGFSYIGNVDGVLYEEAGDCANANSGDCDTIVYWIPCNDSPIIDAGDSNGGESDTGSNDSDGSGDGTNGNDPPDNTGGGGNGTGSTDGNGDDTNNDNDPDDNDNPDEEPCVRDSNGDCIEDITSPLEGNFVNERKNCNELKRMLQDSTVTAPFVSMRDALSDLKNSLSFANEKGYTLFNNSQNEYRAVLTTGSSLDHVKYSTSAAAFGGAHLHQDDAKSIPMFSGQDIFSLLEFTEQYFDTQVDPSIFTLILVNNQGIYALKINNLNLLQELQSILNDEDDANDDGINEYENFIDDLEERYHTHDATDNSETIAGTPRDYQREFLKFINNFDGNGNSSGISLYRADNQLTEWKELVLSEEDPDVVEDKPCNN